MITYGVKVSFLTEHITANNREEVDKKINGLLDELGGVKTNISWDEVEWQIYYQNKPETEEK